MHPKVLFFDVNGTLLDTHVLRESIARVLDGRKSLLHPWFTTLLHCSLVESATETFHPFAEIAGAALHIVASQNGVELSAHDARAAMEPLRSLPAFPDVREGLQQLRDAGYTLVAFTNSSTASLQEQMNHAELTGFFAKLLSVEQIQLYKPHLKTYRWAAEQMGIAPQDALLVAAHGWDCAGARAAGMQAAFIRRAGQSLYPLAPAPEYQAQDLKTLAADLRRLTARPA